MNNQVRDNPFIFNEEIDPQGITDLYGDDYAYMEEVFDTVLKEYDPLINHILVAFNHSDLVALKSAVHKIKPVFGFVGLLKLQEECQRFEQVCQPSASFDMIVPEYTAMKNKLTRAKSIIEEEKKKLELFNSLRA
jgi:HPt (histidine-containing phosphotransfer) domain-containing protein